MFTDSFTLANVPLLITPMKPIETLKGRQREEGTAKIQRETQLSGERHISGSVRQFQKNRAKHIHMHTHTLTL